MLMNCSWRWRSFVSTFVLVCLIVPASFSVVAQEKTEDEKSAEMVEELGQAAQLVAFGRGELNGTTGLKDFKSAEALVAAGAIYLRAHKACGGKLKPANIEVMDDQGKPVADAGKAPSLAEEAEALFDEALAMGSKDKAGLDALIKQAKMVTDRGATGGPRMINRTIQSGKVHTIQIPFDSNSPAHVSMRGTGTTQFEVVGPGGKVLWHSKGAWGFYNWQPGGRGGARNITVKVINKGGPPVAYNITTN